MGVGASCEVDGAKEKTCRARPACPHFLSGEMWDPHSPMLRWVAWLGHLVTWGQEGVKGPRGARVVGQIPSEVQLPQPGSGHPGNAGAEADFCRHSDLPPGRGGQAGPGAGDRSLWVRGCSGLQGPLPACLPGTEGPKPCRAPGRKRSPGFRMGGGERWRGAGKAGGKQWRARRAGRPQCGQCGQCWLQATSDWRWGRGAQRGRGGREGKFFKKKKTVESF